MQKTRAIHFKYNLPAILSPGLVSRESPTALTIFLQHVNLNLQQDEQLISLTQDSLKVMDYGITDGFFPHFKKVQAGGKYAERDDLHQLFLIALCHNFITSAACNGLRTPPERRV